MKTRIVMIALLLTLGLFAGLEIKKQNDVSEETFGNWDIKYGAIGDDVHELQDRLKFLGFYHGKVDGDFGYNTLKSVKNFQYQFGLKIDGIAGPDTKLKLWEATKHWRPTAADLPGGGGGGGGAGASAPASAPSLPSSNRLGLSEQDINLMANAVHGEARGEPYVGQVAVAAVIINRVKHASFPNTISGVIFQPGAFTAVADGQIYLTPNETSKKAVIEALNGSDPSGGCIYYFNPVTATSKWIWSRPQVKQIGRHIFCM